MSIERETLTSKTREVVKARQIKLITVNNEKIALVTSLLPGLNAVVENPALFIAEGKLTGWTEDDLLTTWKVHRRVADKICTLTAGSINLGFHLMISPFAPGGYYENLYESIAYNICFKSTNIPFIDVQEMIAAHEAAHCLLTAPVIPPGEIVSRGRTLEYDLSEHPYVAVPNISLPESVSDAKARMKNAEELIVIKVAAELFPNLSSGVSNLAIYLRYRDECEQQYLPSEPTALANLAFKKALRIICNEDDSPSLLNESAKKDKVALIMNYFIELYRQTRLKLQN